MTNVVCLKWGTKYSAEYVNKLYSAVQRHTTRDFKFWCFTDDPTGLTPDINVADLHRRSRLESWWNKIYLFSKDLPIPLGEQIFYIDLDTLIAGNINDLLDAQSDTIIVLRDFYHGIAKTAGNLGSGLMSWRHGDHVHIWKNFIADPDAAIRSVRPHGDQAWIEQQLESWHCWQDLFPDQVVSFKVHCGKGLPETARIVCYHGKPSIPESARQYTKDWIFSLEPQPWVLDHWK